MRTMVFATSLLLREKLNYFQFKIQNRCDNLKRGVRDKKFGYLMLDLTGNDNE